MERVLRYAGVKSLFLIISLLAVTHTALATTAILPADDDLIVGARAIVRGKVLSVEAALDGQKIFTYITLKVQEVLKGQITERRIVIKEPGGEVGSRGSLVFGTPQFSRGEKVLLYLDTWRDGSLRVHEMFLGRFSIVEDPASGQLMVTRNMPEGGVNLLGQSAKGPITNRMELGKYTEMVRNRVVATVERSNDFEGKAYGNVPMAPRPLEYKASTDGGDVSAQFHLWNPPIRWFEADTGQSVVFKTNTDGAPNPQAAADAVAAMNAWSSVPGCSLRVIDGGATSGCGLFLVDGENTISFNNCDGYFSGSGCSSSILAVASIASYDRFQTKVVNGVSFYKALESNISFNPFSSCSFNDHCNVQEITTHEMGHALGLHHSWDSSFPGTPSPSDQIATMYFIAHFDGRCASLKTDDMNGITFIYPSSGGGPGPLAITTASLANGSVGTVYSQSISASGGTLPYTWSLVAGQGTLPPGLVLSAAGVIAGTPTTAGTSNFTVKVTDGAATTVQRAFSIVVSTQGSGGALNSQFVSQTVPTSVQPGQTFSANLKFLNTGTTTWGGVDYFFASQNPALNQTWGGNGVSLLAYSAAPGEMMDVTFTATAPLGPGTYDFQWEMYQNNGIGFFGQMSTNVSIQVGTPPPPQNGTDTIGVYYPTNRTFYLRNSNSLGFADMSVQYGPSGATPLAGDWDGNGTMTIGVYDPSNQTFYLRNSNSQGFADLTIRYGPPGAIPVVGDWDGDGTDTIGVYDPTSQTFYLRNSNSPGFADLTIRYGPPGAVPVVGDWDGNGTTTIGVYDPSSQTFYLRNSNTIGFADLTIRYGPAGATPVVGDWNGDGTTTIGVYYPTNQTFYLRNSNTIGFADMTIQYGPSGAAPIVGDWDGN